MQTHTPYSVYNAEVNHKVYDWQRQKWWDGVPQETQDAFTERSRENVEQIPVPRNTPIIREKDYPSSEFSTGADRANELHKEAKRRIAAADRQGAA